MPAPPGIGPMLFLVIVLSDDDARTMPEVSQLMTLFSEIVLFEDSESIMQLPISLPPLIMLSKMMLLDDDERLTEPSMLLSKIVLLDEDERRMPPSQSTF